MRKATVVTLLALALAALAGAAGFPEVAGWKPLGEVATYGPDNLWEYVDGAADLFLAFGFQGLEVRELESGGVRVMVSVYDMGGALDAFGVFTTEAAGGSRLPAIGAGAMVSPPYQCLLAKDRFYVKVEASQGEISAGMGEALVATLARALPGADGPPDAVKLLPQDAIVAGSVRYTRQGFLGLAELPACVHASLAGAAKEAQVFVVVPRPGQTVDGIWKALAGKWEAVDHPGRPVLARTVPYKGLVAVIRGQTAIVGVVGPASRDELVTRLESLAR